MTVSGSAPPGRRWHVRPALTADVAKVAAIEATCFSDPWSEASFRSLIAGGRVWFMVAVDDASSDVMGYIVVWFVADEAELANIAVAPATRGQRIGAGLLDEALAVARQRGAAHMYLEVRDSNASARGLYRSRGFEEVGRRRSYYRYPVEDAVVLRRAIEPTTSVIA